MKKMRGRPKGSKNKATPRRLFFSHGLAETEYMMELVDGSGNDNGIVENMGGSEPNRNGRSMTENGSAPEEPPLSGRHWGATEVLCLARSWVTVSQRTIMTTDSMWESMRLVMERRYGIRRTKNSIRSKWKSFHPDAYLYITCEGDVARKYCTGNFDEQQLKAMALRMFTVRKAKVPGATNLEFRYVEAAVFLKTFPKFTDDHAARTGVAGFLELYLKTRDVNGITEKKGEMKTETE